MNKIEIAPQEPCEELLAWVARKWGEDPKEIAGDECIGSSNSEAESEQDAEFMDAEFMDAE